MEVEVEVEMEVEMEGKGEGEVEVEDSPVSTYPINKKASRLNCLHHGLIDCREKHVEHQISTDILGNSLGALQLLRHRVRDVGEVDTRWKLHLVERLSDKRPGQL